MSVRQRLSNFRKRLALGITAFRGGSRFLQAELLKALRRLGRRSPAYSERIIEPSRVLEPVWNYVTLVREAQHHPVVRKIHEAIIRRVTQNWGQVEPLFKLKCEGCGHEYQEEHLDTCEECGGSNLREPDQEQRKTLEAFIATPNRDDEWRDLVVSTLRFMLSTSDWYWSLDESPVTIDLAPFGWAERDIHPNADLKTAPLQVYVEDSRYIRICADTHGRLGQKLWFCTQCYDGDVQDIHYDEQAFKTMGGHCKCGGELKETCYLWTDGSGTHPEVKARFARDEILHSNMDPQLPHLYGVPKLIACLRPAAILTHMDRYNLELYSKGRLAKMIFISGMTQPQVNQMVVDAKTQAEELAEQSLTTGQRQPPQLHTLVFGLDDINAKTTEVPAMPDAEKMQQIEWYEECIERMCAIYGVTPKFEGIAEAGKAGVRIRIDVSPEVARAYQQGLEEPWREGLWPRLGVTDWQWAFQPVEERDELVEARTMQLKVQTVTEAVRSGMEGEIKEDGSMEVHGAPDPEKVQFQPFENEGQQPFESSTEHVPEEKPVAMKGKGGKQWLVRELPAGGESRQASAEGQTTDS